MDELQEIHKTPTHPFHWAPFIICGAAWPTEETDLAWLNNQQGKLSEAPSFVAVGLPLEINQVLKRSDELINNQEFIKAMDILRGALNQFGVTAIPLYERLGDCYAKTCDFENALKYYNEVLQNDPNSFINHYNLGCVYRDFAYVAKAKERFKCALNLNPAYANALMNIAELCNDPQEVLNYLKRAEQITPNDEDVIKGIKVWGDMKNESPKSIAKHRLIWAQDAFTHNNLIYARINLALAREEVLDNVEQAFAYRIESDIYRQEGNLKNSIDSLEKAVRLDYDVPAYWNTLGARRLLLSNKLEYASPERQSLLKKAEEDCFKAIAIANYAKPQQNLAIIYLKLGMLDKAKEHCKVAQKITQEQINAFDGKIICKGCPTGGNTPTECKKCLTQANNTLMDIDLAYGQYSIK